MPHPSEKTPFQLQSVATGNIFNDTGWLLDAPGEKIPTLIRALYQTKQLQLKDPSFGIYRFADWLPVNRYLVGSSAPITYKSEGLARKLGLNRLYITFSGYWPERGVEMKTCSFKETEAYSVCGRLDGSNREVLVVASAGNTARAFAQVCSDNQIPLLLSVPHDNLNALWFEAPLNPCVKLITCEAGSDYFDAIHLSNIVSKMDGFVTEGGAKNVARRDGMGTTMLSAATTIGEIPEYYFQAIGSGTGAIAAWEANLRLIADGRFGNRKARLMVSQNIPFHPIYDAWKEDSREMLYMDDAEARKKVEVIEAKVLSNRKPPYGIVGGLYDVMKDAGGDVLLANNQESRDAAILFKETEGNDIHCAAAVATATLIDASKTGLVKKDDLIMLNITGGGEAKFKAGREMFFLQPLLSFSVNPDEDLVVKKVKGLF